MIIREFYDSFHFLWGYCSCNDTGFKITYDVSGYIKEENALISFGVSKEGMPDMYVFTITKDDKLIWEIYLEHWSTNFDKAVSLIFKADHIYLIGIWKVSTDNFISVWKGIKQIELEETDDIKSFSIIPYSPDWLEYCHFKQENIKNLKIIFKYFAKNKYKVSYEFERFVFQKEEIVLLIKCTHNSSIKLINWDLYISTGFEVSSNELREEFFGISKWNVYSQNKTIDISAIFNLIVSLKKSSYQLHKINLEFSGIFELIKWWDILLLKRKKKMLYSTYLSDLREMMNKMLYRRKNGVLLNLMDHELLIRPLKDSRNINLDTIKGFILTYINLRMISFIYSLTPVEVQHYAFREINMPSSLLLSELEDYTWDIKDEHFSPCETTILFNLFCLLSSISITNSTISFNYPFISFLSFSVTQIKYLYIDWISIKWVGRMNENREMVKEYGYDWKAYWLFWILKQCNLLSSLNEIHIKNEEVQFWEDLSKLVSKHWRKSNIKHNIKIFYFDLNQKSEIEVNQECLWKMFEEKTEFLEKTNETRMHDKVINFYYIFFLS